MFAIRSPLPQPTWLCWLFLATLPLGAQTISDPNFIVEEIYTGNGTISMEFTTDGKLLVCEKRGVILLFTPDGNGGFNEPTTFADLQPQVDFSGESGLLGLALDPEFDTNRHLFVFYTTETDQRVARLTANEAVTAVVPDSEVVLLAGFPRGSAFHKAGDIKFHPHDDALFIALGDDDGYGLAMQDGLPLVQHPDFYYGKILRIDKSNGNGLSDNPFWDGDATSIRSRVWAVGFRNPFRFAFHPEAPVPDVLYSSENGETTDRLSWVMRGSNGAWSNLGDKGGFLDPPDPNHRVLAARPPSTTGIIIASSGPFAGEGPTLYIGNWFSNTTKIDRWVLTGEDMDQLEPIAIDQGGGFVVGPMAVDMEFGTDGAMYLTSTIGDDALGDWMAIHRVRYIGGTPPNASFTTDPAGNEGLIPLTIQFTDTSTVASGLIESWLWDFGDGQTSTDPNPSHTYTEPGVYRVSLRVTSDSALQDTTTTDIRALRRITLNLSGRVYDARSLPANLVNGATELRFFQSDGQDPIAFAGGSGDHGNAIPVTDGIIDLDLNLDLTDHALIVSAGHGSPDGLHAVRAGIGIAPELSTTDAVRDFYLSDRMASGVITDAAFDPVRVDIGTAQNQAGQFIDVGGGRDYRDGTPASGFLHRRETDDRGFYHVALPSGASDALFFFDLVGDTGTDRFAPHTLSQSLSPGQHWARDFLVGTYAGGDACDDLSSIPTTENIDYNTHIQPIWVNSCVGCHNASPTNNGDLNLVTDSYANLVEVSSTQIDGLLLVSPGHPDRSFLFEKVNCATPQMGTRMRPTNPLSLEEQALIRDWILQLEPSQCGAQLSAQYPDWPETSVLDLAILVNQFCTTP
ncbi:PQQ-dependent sugar dehydrogenase [Sulfidibacter corallicola]|uniref:PQQ-dependent sugar dehydrogenase n=1 Tax=Sulfidibacter corallicola TaxID=2818388 RepID=A0A8A4THN2_SULCO|nr:PQQ-dependent sugar dehydrogenase [Sulfidibacter corallicola]QTD49143.1 PQQ-dependent sugar dehydrogenase [Sulfidibacter corallicola]